MNALILFLRFAKVGFLTFGGGYAMVQLFEQEIVGRLALLTADEFANFVSIAQITPGPVGLNSATVAGYLGGGVIGLLTASLGVVAPSLVTGLAAAVMMKRLARAAWMKQLMRGIRPCVIGILGSAVVFFAHLSIFEPPFHIRGQGVAIFALVILLRVGFKKLNPIWVLLLSGVLGFVLP